jgi:putative redox protein
MGEVTVESLSGLRNEVRYGSGRTFTTDEPVELGGEGAGPDPYTLLLAALGSCISMTVTLYARRKAWKVGRVRVRLRMRRVHADDCAECETEGDAFVHRVERDVTIEGELDEEQHARLQEIAHRCPLHRALAGEIVISDIPGDAA